MSLFVPVMRDPDNVDNVNEFVQLNGNGDPFPHFKELLQSYRAEWVKDEFKYGHYEAVPPPALEHQIFEGPDTDIQTGKCLWHSLNCLVFHYRHNVKGLANHCKR